MLLRWVDTQCPSGIGLFDEVFIEIRNRISISDIFVREDEIWVEIINDDYNSKESEFNMYPMQSLRLIMPQDREKFTLKAILLDKDGNFLTYAENLQKNIIAYWLIPSKIYDRWRITREVQL